MIKGHLFDLAIRVISQPHPLPPIDRTLGAIDDGNSNSPSLLGPTYYLGNPYLPQTPPPITNGAGTTDGVEDGLNTITRVQDNVSTSSSPSVVSDDESIRKLDRFSMMSTESDTTQTTSTTSERPNDTVSEKVFNFFSETDDGMGAVDDGDSSDGGDD